MTIENNKSVSSHYMRSIYMHIAPLEIGCLEAEYVNYGCIEVVDTCECDLNVNHGEVNYVIHGPITWPKVIRFLSSWRSFNWLYNGVVESITLSKWNNMIENAVKCSCC